MQRFYRLFAVALLIAAISQTTLAGPREAQWRAVREAVNKGLPQTAITNLEPIIAAALAEKAWPEAAKAVARKIALEGAIEGNRAGERVARLEAEIAKAPPEMRPVLQTLLAHWYWSYFQQNRWRFLQRTQTAEAPGPDFTTWDLPRLFAEIDRHFQSALAARQTLKATPVAVWDGLLEKGAMPDRYRPTLYDFLAHEALEFYTSGEQAGAKAEGEFELTADSPALDEAEKFLQWEPAAPATPAGRAVALYQELLRFHQDSADKSAFLDADLARLVWAWNAASGEDKNARFKAALERFIARWGGHPLAAMASWNLARVVKEEGNRAGARRIALQAGNAHPGSPGAKLCANLVAEIEAKESGIRTERVWNSNPVITVRYRNVDRIFFRAYPADWESFLDRQRPQPEGLDEKELRKLLATPAAHEWSAALPPTPDYKEREHSLSAPAVLEPGFYLILASHDPEFGERDNHVSVAAVWVSELALVLRPRAGLTEGFVLEAGSGEPAAGAEVRAWHLDPNGRHVPAPPLTTDTNGFFSFKPVEHRHYLFRVRHQGRELAGGDGFWNHAWQERGQRGPRQHTVFFTDRALYRPGQTIQYKGICLETDPDSDTCRTLAGESLEVVFRDVNGLEIARARHRANDFGSFAGSFTAPRDRLTGAMSIEAEGRAQGAVHIRVEEYKRPKFEVALGAPKAAPKLGETVSIPGKAASHTGAAVDGATVQWRVTREVRWPWWRGWQPGGFPTGPARQIAHGAATTGSDGSFTIEFIAKPDRSIPPADEPVFIYAVTADATDTAGETRSAERRVRVGHAALEATLAAAEWQEAGKPVEVKVTTATLDGDPQAAEGVARVHRLQSPARVLRAAIGAEDYNGDGDSSNPESWELAGVVEEHGFTTDTNGVAKISFTLPAGAYRVTLETRDRFGQKVTGRLPLKVLDPAAPSLGIKVPQLVAAPSWEAQPGGEFAAVWGTGYETGRAFIEIEHRDRIIQRFWTAPGRTQQRINLAVTEAMRGGFTLHVTQVRENRGYLVSRHVRVPWKNKKLELKWERFVSKLTPGQKETWTLVIRKPPGAEDGGPPPSDRLGSAGTPLHAAAELAATLYDASLDAFAPHHWRRGFDVFRHDHSTARPRFENTALHFQHRLGAWRRRFEHVAVTYRRFPPDLTGQVWGYGGIGLSRAWTRGGGRGAGIAMMDAAPSAMAAPGGPGMEVEPAVETRMAKAVTGMPGLPSEGAPDVEDAVRDGQPAASLPDLAQVVARRNLNETAFFFPHLASDSNGVVRMTFTMPEALTRWRFLGFAHDARLRAGLIEGVAVTARDIMARPNPPRFLREGDTVEFPVTIFNQSDQPQRGLARLSFHNAMTRAPVDALLAVRPLTPFPGGADGEIAFDIPARESRTYAWRLTVPDGAPFLTYKAVASAGALSDGEEGYLPVLSRRIFVTESLPLPVRGKPGGGEVARRFQFAKLLDSGQSPTLRHEGVTVRMVSQPAWYAVLALPYLMEFPHQGSEQTFNRLYANALARHIANSDPKIRRVFDQWRNTPALDSPLEKHQDLRAVMIEETPWHRHARSESEARRNAGVLFDDNRLNDETRRALEKLAGMQLGDGRWPWFQGGYGNDYITLYIVTGFGRLRHLGVDAPAAPAVRAIHRLDEWMTAHYQRIQRDREKPQDYVPSPLDALYLYGRSFFLKDQPVAPPHRKAVDFFLRQSRKFWLQTNHRRTQGHLAIALKRFNTFNNFTDSTPADIVKSLKERSVTSEETGRFWRDTEPGWRWYHAPIETQALMIEAFDEVAGDAQAVEECRVWLLKQKQTQSWSTTKATADAVYALLLRGASLLGGDALVEVSLGGINVTPPTASGIRPPSPPAAEREGVRGWDVRDAVEPGTGFYERRFTGAEVKPEMGEITVRKVDEGVSWGGVHWQYFEDISKVTPHEATPLHLKKTLFTKVNTAAGPTLKPVQGPLAVGDELVTRLELRVDRDMEFVHLKAQRASGTEPVNVLSRYRYQDGLAYYESARDTATHFFLDSLPSGSYVFEYSTRVRLRGEYQTGRAGIMSMYAPEFSSHSGSYHLVVK